MAAPVVTEVTGAVAAASMRLLLPHCFGMDVVVMHFVVFVVVAFTTIAVAYKRRALCILSAFTFYLYENDNNKNLS